MFVKKLAIFYILEILKEYSSEYSIENWINRADDKLYCGKRDGKNQTVY